MTLSGYNRQREQGGKVRRLVTTVVALLFTFTVLPGMVAAQTPMSTPGPSPVTSGNEWQVTGIRAIEVEGESLVLSPDGQWLAGLRDDRRTVCIWDLATLSPSCVGVGAPVQVVPLIGAPVWASDSSALAFVAGLAELGQPTDVMVLEAATGELTNLTQTPDDEVWIHAGPDWMPDGERLLFAQTDPNAGERGSSAIVHISRAGGDPVTVLSTDWNTGVRIYSSPVVMPDGAVLFRVDTSREAGLWYVALDGSDPALLFPDHAGAPLKQPAVAGVSDNGQYVFLVPGLAARPARTGATSFLIDFHSGDSVAVRSVETVVELKVSAVIPDDTIAVRSAGQPDRVTLIRAGATPEDSSQEIPPEAISAVRTAQWAENDTVFVPNDQGGILITLEVDS